MDFYYFVGIDTSKGQLDAAVWSEGQILEQHTLANEVSAIRKYIKQLRGLKGFNMSTAVFCLEHTGIYNAHLLKVLHQSKAQIVLVAAVEVQRSLGLQRGKNDQIDAVRIATYAARFSDKLQLWEPPRKVIDQLQQLSVLRQRLIKAKGQLEVPLKEAKEFLDEDNWGPIEEHSKEPLEALSKALERIEHQIQQLIQQDDQLHDQFQRITSIPGVGRVLASEVLIQTNEFRDFREARKFACHAGIAPFEHRSGSSVRGRPRVSHRANKRLKTLLHLSAMAAIRSKNEFQAYYLRKTLDGKNKMSVLNAVRNKILHRIFAVVRNETTYQENYQFNFVKP